jgi:putative GTP pyrophosphokinase
LQNEDILTVNHSDFCRKSFEEKYNCSEMIAKLEKTNTISWAVLESIYQDYKKRRDNLEKVQDSLLEFLNKLKKQTNHIHSIGTRIKDDDHLIYKIVRKLLTNQLKYSGICKENYYKVITDFVGGRILLKYLKDWQEIDELIQETVTIDRNNNIDFLKKPDYNFKELNHDEIYMVEDPKLYLKWGSPNFSSNRIKTEYSYKCYRSVHYTLKIQNEYCELQLRTLADEIYAEFSHDIYYPISEKNVFLNRYAEHVSKLSNEIDDMMSMYWFLPKNAVEICAANYIEEGVIYPELCESTGLTTKKVDVPSDSDTHLNPIDRIMKRMRTSL